MVENFHDRDGYIWMDGKLVDWRDANIHVLSHALHYASSVFEGARCYDNHPFKIHEHNERLLNSAALMGMKPEWSADELDEIVNETIKANGYEDCYIRPVMWRGSEQMGVSAPSPVIHLAVAVWSWPSYFTPEMRMKGIRLEFSQWKRPSPETIPCAAKAAGLYMICTLSKDQAERNGYEDALMMDYKGRVAEATGANVFLYRERALHTPIPDCILNGITRQTVIELARERGIEVIEREIMPDELGDFEQVFLTGTAAEVTPVSEIGPHKYKVGDVCQTMMRDYDDLVHRRVSL
jgi:branched-chain amino acid aminotransferase